MAGVLSLLLIDLSAVLAAIPAGLAPNELPSPAILKIISLIQPTVLLTIAVVTGILLAHRVGLHAAVAEAVARGEGFLAKLKPQLLPGVLVGIACGLSIVIVWVIAKPFLSAEFVTRAQEFNILLPAAVRFLYGGLTEELLLRWGLMTLLVWAAWRIFQGGKDVPKPAFVVAAILVSALVFGLGHLPVASLLAGGLTPPLVVYVVTANSLFGVAAGFLYWKRGLESAMIAHMFAHVVLIAAIAFSL